MLKVLKKTAARAALGVTLMVSAIPSYGSPAEGLQLGADSSLELVRIHRPPIGVRPPVGVRPPHVRPPHVGVRPPVYRHRYHGGYRYPNGVAIGAGIVGGIIAGAAIADAASQDGYNRCAAEFRSFNPETGTYVGYDGVVRACPYLH